MPLIIPSFDLLFLLLYSLFLMIKVYSMYPVVSEYYTLFILFTLVSSVRLVDCETMISFSVTLVVDQPRVPPQNGRKISKDKDRRRSLFIWDYLLFFLYIYLSIYFYIRLNRVAIINNSHCILLPFIIVVLLHVHSIFESCRKDRIYRSSVRLFLFHLLRYCETKFRLFPLTRLLSIRSPFRILTTRIVFTYELSFFYHPHGPMDMDLPYPLAYSIG